MKDSIAVKDTYVIDTPSRYTKRKEGCKRQQKDSKGKPNGRAAASPLLRHASQQQQSHLKKTATPCCAVPPVYESFSRHTQTCGFKTWLYACQPPNHVQRQLAWCCGHDAM
jgi:hypothetical protein